MGWRKSSWILLWTVAQLFDWGVCANCTCKPECEARDGIELVEAWASENCPEVCVVSKHVDLEKGLREAKTIRVNENKSISGCCGGEEFPTIFFGEQWRDSKGFPDRMAEVIKRNSNQPGHRVELRFSGVRLCGIKLNTMDYDGPSDISYMFEDSILFVHSHPDFRLTLDSWLNQGVEVPKSKYTDLCKGFCLPRDHIYMWKNNFSFQTPGNPRFGFQAKNTLFVVSYASQQQGSNSKIKPIHILSGILATVLAAFILVYAVKKRSKREVFTIEGVGQVRVKSERLGQGAYGNVRAGTLRHERNSQAPPVEIPVAVKEVGRKQMCASNGVTNRAMAQRDIELSVSFKHENIVKCHGVVDLSSDRSIHYLIVMERLQGDLHKFIYENQILGSPCTYRNLLNIFLDIVSGLQYLHNVMKCIHFDLKPFNILLTPGHCCKLADFGMSKICGDGSVELTQGKGTRWYTAPETWILGQFENLQGQRVNTSVDIYSLGIVMWECIMRQEPGKIVHSPGVGPVPTIEMHSESSSFCIECDCVPSLRDLISRCVNFHFDLFIEKLRAGDHTSETFGRPCLEEIQDCLHSMLSEQWVDGIPPRWR